MRDSSVGLLLDAAEPTEQSPGAKFRTVIPLT